MQYREFLPPVALRPFVRCLWTLKGEVSNRRQRIVPDGSFELVFHRNEPFARDGLRQPQSLFIGEVRRPVILTPSAAPDIFGVRFGPGGASAFFRLPMSELRDTILPLSELCVTDEQGVVDLLLKRRTPPPRWRSIAAAIHIIESRRGAVRVRSLAAEIGISERTLERSFDAVVGMLPKTFCRLTRFQGHLAAPSQDAGYVDDSHLGRDYHEFAGTTRSEYGREQHELRDNFAGIVQEEGRSDA